MKRKKKVDKRCQVKIIKITWLNATASTLCLYSGIYSFCRSNILMGILSIIFAVLNLYCVLNFIASWWELSPKVYSKFVFTCPRCDCQFIPSFWRWFFVPHFGSRRYMRCEKCKEIHWMRRK